jgi:hypothetical protein
MNVISVMLCTLLCPQNCDGEMSKQLEYILKLHRGDCQPDHSSTSDEENGDDDTVSQKALELSRHGVTFNFSQNLFCCILVSLC